VVVREGKGRVVYFTDDIDRTFWLTWNPDLGRLLGNAVRWATGETQSVHVAGAGLLDVFYGKRSPAWRCIAELHQSGAAQRPRARDLHGRRAGDSFGPAAGFHPAKVSLLHARKEVPFRVTGSELRSPSHKSVN